jgi:hypothetical protein
MPVVSSQLLDEVGAALVEFKAASGNGSAYAAAHLAGAVEALLDDARRDHHCGGAAPRP